MNELVEGLKQTLRNEDARYIYADTAVNSLISAQIKALREDRRLSQQDLAELIGTKQSGVSRLEKAGYSEWKIETLRKLARAFGVRLRIGFDEFGTLPADIGGFTRDKLCPRRFEDDPVFRDHAEKQTPARIPDEAPVSAGSTVGDLRPRLPVPRAEALGKYYEPMGIHLVPKPPAGSFRNPIDTGKTA